MKRHLGSGRISPPAGFEPVIRVGSANHSATRMLPYLKKVLEQPRGGTPALNVMVIRDQRHTNKECHWLSSTLLRLKVQLRSHDK